MEPSTVSIRQTSLCLPFDSEAHYQTCVENLTMYRQHIEAIRRQHAELLPKEIAAGYSFHSKYWSVKQQLLLRRIQVKATGRVFLIRPSLVMPYMVARTDALDKPLRLRQYPVPFEELAYQFGRDKMVYYRACGGQCGPGRRGRYVGERLRRVCARSPGGEARLSAPERLYRWLERHPASVDPPV